MTKPIECFDKETFLKIHDETRGIQKLNKFELFCFHLVKTCVGDKIEVCVQDSELPGTPDITIPKFRLAIFCDGNYWHDAQGKPMTRVAIKFLANDADKANFWYNKAETNRKRDKEVNKKLKEMGYKVIRFKELRINGYDPLGYVSSNLGLAFFREGKKK